MWIVFNIEDSSELGWQVSSEREALRQCRENDNLDYIWKES